ncbi:acyltransferase [Pseudohongiella sp. O18]|uniref:acyltransferase n=1 Tax=Pseudohongiella sp. O18 TaxID=2904248 RepID=UPI001F16A0D4|nr:acyltransferase [Pseudohongiella sp. O18]
MERDVEYIKPSKGAYLARVSLSLLRFRTWKYFAYSLAYWFVNFVVPRSSVSVGHRSDIHPTALLRHAERIFVGDNVLINHGNVLQAGKAKAKILLGNYVHTGPNVMMFAYNHRFEKGTPSKTQNYDEADIVVGNDVWIGAGSIILAGTVIEDGCVIAAGSVVRGKLEANGIYVGVPAKLTGHRR